MRASRFLIISAAVGVALLLGASPADASGQVRLTQLLSPRVAKEFLMTVDWGRYEATQINIAEDTAWEDPAIYLDLKGDAWTVEFPNDRFLSLTRFFLGDIANPRPVKVDIKKAALELLERDLVHVFRVRLGKPEGPDQAIILTPYTIQAFTLGDTIRIKLDDNGLQTREGDLTGGDDRDGPSGR
ncbi:MAG: hypothetical protein IH975_01865 [Nitrospinae bacterium]|nr:hypothetical protein [Nitrospinota bacterium]